MSSYGVFANGGLGVISGSIPNRQTDTCWLVITQDGRYAYTASFGSGTITSYRFTSTGAVRVIKGKAAFLGVLSQPVDLAFSTGSHYLYLLLQGTGGLASFKVQADGGLTPLLWQAFD